MAGILAAAVTDEDTVQNPPVSMIRANEIVRRAREGLGLSEEQAAARAGLTIHEYGDVELHADEFYSALSLAAVRRICSALNIDLPELLAAEQLLTSRAAGGASARGGVPRHQLIRDYRIARSASIGDVASAIGFQESAVELGESREDYLESLPIRVLIDWARFLGVDARAMLGL